MSKLVLVTTAETAAACKNELAELTAARTAEIQLTADGGKWGAGFMACLELSGAGGCNCWVFDMTLAGGGALVVGAGADFVKVVTRYGKGKRD